MRWCLSAFPPSPGYQAPDPSRFWSPLPSEDFGNPGKESGGSPAGHLQAGGWGQLASVSPQYPAQTPTNQLAFAEGLVSSWHPSKFSPQS